MKEGLDSCCVCPPLSLPSERRTDATAGAGDMTGQTDTDKKILRSRRTIHRIGATTTEEATAEEGQITKAAGRS